MREPPTRRTGSEPCVAAPPGSVAPEALRRLVGFMGKAGALACATLLAVACTLMGDDLEPDAPAAEPGRDPDAEDVALGLVPDPDAPADVATEEGTGPRASADACAVEERTPCGCEPCALGGSCARDADCVEGDCVAGRCAEPSCTDGVQNQSETDVDCGGDCGPCAVGDACQGDDDCDGDLFCASAASASTCSPPSCQDGFASGDEAGVDCGGDCPGCPDGTPCRLGSDCSSGVCGATGRCSAPDCADGVQNQGERDADCGGPCGACDAGQRCQVATDCASGVCGAVGCAAGEPSCCQPVSCVDGVANGAESDVDCGGDGCDACPLDAACGVDGDCESGFCQGGRCAVRLVCGNGLRDGPESDVDCGGSEPGCPRCQDRQLCQSAGDCQSGRCDQGRCGSCFDGVQSGDEQGVDCGGTDPACSPCIRCTAQTSADLATVGTLVSVPADGCAMITQFPGYPPTLIEGHEQGPYPMSFSWRQECTGVTGNARFDRPYHQIPLSGLSQGCPVFFELSGSAAPLGIRWW